ncbi:hypothetical protein F2P56_031180 [Juglans regia]|uniref:Protein MODIFYING WALL LIGNIN-1-like n=2 Tax=Juglans regia TaxID=51240 RepID=A0A833WID7_JUGRE|nr:protein MODIFYING WALL LIGNIN-2-like [Juglans regia]KAF5450863.1 hypothetical protein F2P56_031180 [Juglans regia]
MTETRFAVICCVVTVVGFLGLVSAATGFAAEATRIKPSQVQINDRLYQCVYPRSPATALGSTAVLALIIAKIIINVSTGCSCCKRSSIPSNSSSTALLIFSVFSWITFVVAIILLVAAVALNNKNGAESIHSEYACYVVKPGVFAGGALLSVASVVLGIAYYLTLISVKKSSINNPASGSLSGINEGGPAAWIAMGQPQFPSNKDTRDQPLGA